MNTPADLYKALTPFGPVEVEFPEDSGVIFHGEGVAVDHLLAVIGENTNSQGQVMTPANLEPHDFFHFCQPEGSGVKILAPIDDPLSHIQDPDMNQQHTLDDAGGASLHSLRQTLKVTQGVMAKLNVMLAMVNLLPKPQHVPTITNVSPESINDVSEADEAVASGERPRRSTSHLYDFDPDRKNGQRKRDNAAAMALLAQIDAGDVDGSNLTDEQKAALVKYSGTGGGLQGVDGKKGSAYEYYTPKPIAEGMWQLLGELGFAGGRVLDPCAAVGVFGSTAPVNAAVDAVELNETSGRINGLVNDGAGYKAVVSPFEAVAAATPDETYDAVVSNVPFGEVSDRGGNQFKDTKYQKEPIQNYFILRSLEKLRPGGLAMFITPPRCVSGKGGKEEDLRYRASMMAEFMGAYRLPNKIFGTADADTITDVIVFRKFSREVLDKVAELSQQNPKVLTESNVLWQEFIGGQYFTGEGKPFILGTMGKVKGKWGEVDALHSDLSISEIAKLMRKFPGSRINWELLEATETAPLVYQEGDTLSHAGQTLEMKDGRWVALDSVNENDSRAEFAATIKKLGSALDAVQNNVTYAQAVQAHQWMIDTAQALDIPLWLRGALTQIANLPESARGTYWSAGIAGIAALEVMGHHQGEEVGFNYLEGYPELSEKIKRVSTDAKKPPTRLSGQIRDGMARIGVIFDKKVGFNAVWRGDVVTTEVDARTESERVEAVKYRNGTLFVSLEDAKGIYGEGFDPIASPDWCVSADGSEVCKASDYYVGNYADFIRKIDGQIAAATDDTIKGKLLRQKAEADAMVDRVDATHMSFNLFSPFVTLDEKADFLRRFVDPRFSIGYDDDGKAVIECDIKAASTQREKLLKRFAQYLKNGSHTLGGIDVANEKEAMAALRTMTQTANEQFGSWVKSNPAVMSRLNATANDPERLYFRQVDDEAPMEIPGLNPDWKMHGYQNAEIRKKSRNFGGINGFGVGLGKTATALACVQYAHSIGVKSKTLFVVPNSVLSNWRKEAGRVYATTNDCLFVGLVEGKDGSFKVDSKAYDKDLMRILENRHKKIYLTMEAFQRLRLREETAQLYDNYLASVDSSYAESDLNKKNERAKSKREELIYQLANDSAKSAAAPFFEDLGVDSLVIDEAHAYKNAANVNEFKGGKFLSMAEASNRGLDAQAKAWYVRRSSGDRGDGVLCLTATPVTNSPLEIYSMLALSTGHARLNDMMMGIKGADHFMSTMCRLENEDEETIDGTVKAYDVFTGLGNVDILRNALGQVCSIKNAEDVGAQIKVPSADESATPVKLPADVVATLQEYKSAFRFALDTLREKPQIGGDAEAYARVAEKFGEPMELIAHPFNLINKMTALIQDKELDERGTFYTFAKEDRALAEKVVGTYNAKPPIEDRSREGPQTSPAAVVGTKTKKDGDSTTELLRIQALARIDGVRIIIDTISADTQAKFEAVADKAGLALNVSVPPKLAAMLENFQKEEANPRGVGDDGQPTGRVKQIIFCDVLAMHCKIKRLLTQRCGIAAGSIAIITGSINGKPEEIIDVQDGFNAEGDENKYRVIIANEKAEVGINLQKGTQAIHHLTIGWTPDSLTQRNGRGVRQGNKTDRVSVYHYDADGTFDTYKRMLVGKKANWIDAVMDKNGGSDVNVEGGLSKEQLEELVNSIGDADAIGRIQERAEAAERAARAATTKAKQVVNLQTSLAQAKFLRSYDTAVKWAADKLGAYVRTKAQIQALTARLDNPKLTNATAIKTKGLLAEVQTRLDGLKITLNEGLVVHRVIRQGYGSNEKVELTGDRLDLDTMVSNAIGDLRKGQKPDEKAAEWLSGGHYGYDVKITQGSAIENEWQSEVDMAKSMIDESRKEFAALSEKDGGYSAGVLEHLDSGEAAIIDGKVVCVGAFIRAKGELWMVELVRGRFEVFAFKKEDGQLMNAGSASDMMRGGEVVLPGAAGYDDCISEAAAIEDGLFNAGSVSASVMPELYSAHVSEVAQRRTAVAQIKYRIGDYHLPAPYFPLVVKADDVTSGDAVVAKAIYEKQKPVVVSTEGDGYYASFTASSDVAVVKGMHLNKEKALHEYALAHGLKLTTHDLEVFGVSLHSLFKEFSGPNNTFESEVLSATTPEELDAKLQSWIRSVVPAFDFDGNSVFSESPVTYLKMISLSLGQTCERMKASLSMGKTPEQAQESANVDPNRMVGITGDTRTWKDRIKMCATQVGSRPIWDGTAGCWNVSYKAWLKLLESYPSAEQALNMVEASGKTNYGRRRS